MGSSITSRGAHYRYPLVENRVQAEIMTYVRAEARAAPRARLNEALSSSRGKISAEVTRLDRGGVARGGGPGPI